MFNKAKFSIEPFRVSSAILIALAACLLMGLPARAQDEKASKEINAVVKKIHALMREAEELQEAGDLDAADAVRKKAEKLEVKLRAFHEKQERSRHEGPEKLERILDGLERGMVALDELDRREELEMLRRIADGVRERMKRGESGERERAGGREREIARHQIEVMKMAMPAILEAGRKDTAELLEHAIHARELALEGRRDPEATRIRESAPDLGVQVEILTLASKLWREYGNAYKAEAVGRLAEEFHAKLKRSRQARPEREREEAPSRELEEAREQIAIMGLAWQVLREAEKKDAADIMMRAIEAHTVRLKGLKGEEAQWILEHEPKLAAQVEILALASRLWKEFGHERDGETVGNLVERLGARLKRDQHRGERARVEKTEELEARIAEIKAVIEALEAELRAMDRRGR
jgi:transposase